MSLYFYILTLFFWLCFLTPKCDCEDDVINSVIAEDLSEIFNDTLSESIKKCEVKEVNSGLMKKCQFPFIFQNYTFYGCTDFGAPGEGKPWCSTKIDPLDFQHVTGNGYYGDCPLPLDTCPTDDSGLNAENNYIQSLELSEYEYFLFG